MTDLYRLLRSEFCESRAGVGQADVNAWYEAKQARGDVRSYAEDVALAWRVSELALGNGHTPRENELIGLQCRYALLMASVASLAATVPAEAIPLLVANGVWSPLEAVARALQAPDPEQRLEALTGVLPALIQDGRVAEALAAAGALTDDKDRATALSSLTPHLSEREVLSALKLAASIDKGTARIRAHVSLAPRLSDAQREAVLAEALDDARSLPELYDRAWILAEVASALPGEAREAVLAEALAAARAINVEFGRAWAIAQVAGHLSSAMWPEALEIIGEMEAEIQRAQALRMVAPFLPECLLDRAVELAHELEGFWREEPLSALAPLLAEVGRPQEALHITLGLVEELWRADALAGIAPFLPPELLNEATAVLPQLEEHSLARALSGMAPSMPEPLLAAALELANSVEDEWSRAEALSALVSHLDEHLLMRIASAEAIASPVARSLLLEALASALAKAGRAADALAAVGQLESVGDRATTGFEVARQLPPPARERALKQALAETGTVGDRESQGRALAGVIAELASLGAAHEAVEWIPAIQDDAGRGRCLSSLVAHLPEELLEHALDLAVGISDPFWRMQAVEALAPRLSRQLLAHAVATARAVDSDPGLVGPSIARIFALASSAHDAFDLLGKVPGHALPEVLNAIAPYLSEDTLVRTFDDLEDGFLPGVVHAIAPYLSEPARGHLVEAAAGLEEIERAGVLVEPPLTPRKRHVTKRLRTPSRPSRGSSRSGGDLICSQASLRTCRRTYTRPPFP